MSMAKNSDEKTKLPPVSVSLALQGGGTHSAFNWGVIDYLLEKEEVNISAISATSIGALVASVVASAMEDGNRSKARGMLESFWKKIALAARLSPFQPTMVDKFLGNSSLAFSPSFVALDFITKIFSPYQFNMFDINPLKEIINETINSDSLRKKDAPRLFIGATNVQTGEYTVFGNDKINQDVLLASTCLPFVFKTVTIDGNAYWEGGFTGNPSIKPLMSPELAKDIIIVQSIPFYDPEVPTKASDILDRANEISFNSSLMKELEHIEFVNKLIDEGKIGEPEYQRSYIHHIQAGDILAPLGKASKLNADMDFLHYLRDTGRQAAEDWYKNNAKNIAARTAAKNGGQVKLATK